jgi:predicted kinase
MSSFEPFLVLIRGHQGSGKSTLALSMAAQDARVEHIENDHFFTLPDGVYQFDPARHQEAKSHCLRRVALALAEGRAVVVSNTLTTLAEIAPFLRLAAEHRAPVRIIEMDCDFASVHGVPREEIERKKKAFEPWLGEKTVVGPEGERHEPAKAAPRAKARPAL